MGKDQITLFCFFSDVPNIPLVNFSSSSYSLQVDVTQIGLVGHVQATADNGESLRYIIQTDNCKLIKQYFILIYLRLYRIIYCIIYALQKNWL